MIDIAIIGAGPAGLSAAVNAAARNKKCTIFGRKKETSAIYKAKKINNHLGMPEISGKEMLDAFYKHAMDSGVEIVEGRVGQIMPMGNYFVISVGTENYEAKAVILATGASYGKKIKGESEYLGKGVSYCATCDGMLYRGKDVIVLSENEEGDEDANFLSEICKHVYYFPVYGKPENVKSGVNVLNGKIVEITGDEYVTKVMAEDREIPCDGVFLIKDSAPLDTLIFGLEIVDNKINVNRNMETNLQGVFACGDCTGWPLQVSSAVGEGLTASQQAVRFLDKNK